MVLAIVAVTATALIAVAAQAAPRMPDASISLAGAAQARAADATPTVGYGSYVEFDYTLDAKMGKNNYLTINVECVQGDEVVYKRSGQTTQAFHMYAQGGNVYSWDGERADCTARLRYYAHHRLNIVASTAFTVVP